MISLSLRTSTSLPTFSRSINNNPSYDNAYAIQQIEEGHNTLLMRRPETHADEIGPSKKGKTLPRIITLGGDHTITLPLLRSVTKAYGPISVIHFDSHLDTWRPKVFGGAPSEQAAINHGTYFYHAHEQGLLANDTNIHAGIRTTLSGLSDYDHDGYCGFEIVEAREIDMIGTEGIIKKIRDRVGTEKPVYLSIDIDTLDPACKSPRRFSQSLPQGIPKLTASLSCPCNRHPRNRRLEHPRTPYHHPRSRRHQFCRGRYCRSRTCVRY